MGAEIASSVHNQDIINAVKHLYGKGRIKIDKDISDATGYNKSTVSGYISGAVKASGKFRKEFEKVFELSLKDFEHGNGPDKKALPTRTVDKVYSDHQAYLKLLEDNDRFFKTEYHNLLLSLKELIAQGQRAERLIKLNLQHIGTVEALQKGIDEDEIQAQIGSQIAGAGED